MVSIIKHITAFLIALIITGSALSQPDAADSSAIKKVYKSLDAALLNPAVVYRLDLSKQKLSEFPEEIFALTNLQELTLDKNRLKSIPPEINRLQNLRTLRIQHNEIEVIPEQLFQLQELSTLDLADNLIERVPDNIGKLSNLRTLALWDNPISYYPATLGDLEQLKVLDLLNNDISKDTQNILKSILPGVKLIMSPPCACNDGGEE